MIADVMRRLQEKLYMLYSNELLKLNIGYSINKNVVKEMMDVISCIMKIQLKDNEEDNSRY